MGSLLRIGALALCALASGCGFLQVDQHMRRLDVAVYFTGIVQTERDARGPIVVVLYTKDGDAPQPVYLDVVPRSRGVYHLAAPAGRYGILAFEDVNRDMQRQPGEPVVLYDGTPLGLEAINEPPSATNGLGSIRIPTSTPDVALPAVFGKAYAALLELRNEEFGAQVLIDDARFARKRVLEGLFRPLQFLEEGRAGMFMLEPYDPNRVPVIFVHGVGGSPRDWEYVIDKLDQSRFQAWVCFYPSGVPIGLSALLMSNALDELHYRYGFATSIVVAHSMGGVVARGVFNIIEREGRDPPVHHVVTISTPWQGHAAARWASFGPTRMPGAWLDMAPDSPYLRELAEVHRPADIRHTLFFGYGGPSPIVPGNNDGVVSLQSVLDPAVQSRADFVYGFDESHNSILRSQELVDKLAQQLLR